MFDSSTCFGPTGPSPGASINCVLLVWYVKIVCCSVRPYIRWYDVTGWTIKETGLDFWQGKMTFFFSKASLFALRPTQPYIHIFAGVKQTEYGADHLP